MAQLGILSPIPIIEKILSRMVILIYSQHHFSIAAVHLTSKLLYDCIKLHSVQVVIQLIQKKPADMQTILIRPYLSDRGKLLMSKCDPTHSAKYESIKVSTNRVTLVSSSISGKV